MIANEAVKKYGRNLIGKQIITETMGAWPGGLSVVTNLGNEGDLDIVLFVRCLNHNVNEKFGEMGIFYGEDIQLLKKVKEKNVKRKD